MNLNLENLTEKQKDIFYQDLKREIEITKPHLRVPDKNIFFWRSKLFEKPIIY
jgi:hypothetical protein